MEQVELGHLSNGSTRIQVFQQQQQQQRHDGRGPCGRRLITLRKYSPFICVVELITIALFVYLLVFRATNHKELACRHQHHATSDALGRPKVFTWHNDTQTGTGKHLILDLIEGCDQRKHDYQKSVVCRSRQIDACGPVVTRSDKMLKPWPTEADTWKTSTSMETIVITTSKSGDRLKVDQIVPKRVECKSQVGGATSSMCSFKTRVVVDPTVRRQKIIGWGGALTDSTINNLLSLTTNGTRQLLADYFGDEGLRFNMVRITIGGSDFSSRFYTNDDSPTGDDDVDLKGYSLRTEDILYKIPALKLLQEGYDSTRNRPGRDNYGELKVFASMWSPPVWMKTNGHFNKGQLKGHIDDEPVLDASKPPKEEQYYNALAELKVRFISDYQRQGINFWGLTVMNEPLFAVQPFLDFNTMIFPSDDYANYVAKYLGPKIKSNPQLKHIKLMAHDDNRRFLETFTWPIMDRRRVRQFLDGVSVHGYADEAYHMLNETFNRYRDDDDDDDENLARTQPGDAHFFVLPTELCSGHLPFMAKALIGNWHRGVHYALDIIRSLQNAAAGWVDWNMALDLEGGPGWLGGRLDAPIIVDKARDLYHKSPMFYVLGHFSRYIPPGSIKIDSQVFNAQFDHQFEVVSFLLPPLQRAPHAPRVATIILNNNPYQVDVHLKMKSTRSQVNNERDSYRLIPCPADSIQTVIYDVRDFPGSQ